MCAFVPICARRGMPFRLLTEVIVWFGLFIIYLSGSMYYHLSNVFAHISS